MMQPFTPAHSFADGAMTIHGLNDLRLRVKPDRLGPVNQILTLMRGSHPVRSVLYPVRAGATVIAGTEGAHYWEAFDGPGWRALMGEPIPEPEPYRPPVWFIEVDGKRILEVPEHETWPPIPPKPTPPLLQRMRTALRQQMRADADWIAGRLGYHRADECGGWDE